ncbi:MAG: FAD-dependent oxidoreductase [Actinomycetota bacterium]|nr:FAD-dependent oxidoreductase [Actinomycetota bacterium]
MTADALDPICTRDAWLAADQARVWERAEVISVDRSRPVPEPRTSEPRTSEPRTSGSRVPEPRVPRSGVPGSEVLADERKLGTAILRLRLPNVPDALPGQYYLVRLPVDSPPGVAEQAYSVCSSPYPSTPEIEVAVREVPHGRVSTVLARRTRPGDVLEVRGPFGFLTWTERDRGPIGLVGAGTGVAPLAAIIRYGAARGLEIPMTLLCSSRDRSDVLLGTELDAFHHRFNWFTLVHTFTRAPYDPSVRYHRRIDTGMLADVFMAAPPARRPNSYYVAGPADMVTAVRAMLGTLGVTDDRIYSEDHS